MFNDLLQEVSILINKEDIYYKFDEWKPKRGKNILLVTGLSGSGKTTLSIDLSNKYKAKILHLDAFDDMDLEYDDTGVIEKYFKLNKIKPVKNKFIGEIEGLDYEKVIVDFIKFAVNELSEDYKNLYIIEGLQIYVYMPDYILEDFPIVIKGTSYLTSQYRRMVRKGNIIKSLIQEIRNYGLSLLKLNFKDRKLINSLEKKLKPQTKGYGVMFNDLLREASMTDDYYLPDENGKIKAFEDAFGNNEIKKAIAYGFSSSHEYNTPEKKIFAVKSCIKFVNNYDWKKKDLNIDEIESFNKPLNMKKVYNIAKSIEEEGIIEPLIVVDKIHGFNWQSRGKAILTDGNHRLGAIKVLEFKKTPTYYGTYTGNAEKDHEDFIPNIAEDNNSLISESVIDGNFITNEAFKNVDNIKNFFIESTNEYKILHGKALKRLKLTESINDVNNIETILIEAGIEKEYLTPEEQEAVKKKYGDVECTFAKDKKTGKYFCYTHRARSKFYDSPTDIPKDQVKFVSSTS